MGFFDNMKDRAVDLAQAGVAQSKRLAEIAKLKTANLGEEDTIKKAYIELGKLYYAEKGASPDGAYVAACGGISMDAVCQNIDHSFTGSKAKYAESNKRLARRGYDLVASQGN